MSHLQPAKLLTCLLGPVCLSAVALLLTPHGLLAQDSSPEITVSGTVRDISGNPVEDAAVLLEDKATGSSVQTKTRYDGTFSFAAPHPGTYVARARKEGMREAISGPLELSSGQKKQLDLVLNLGFGNGLPVENPPIAQPTRSELDDKFRLDDKTSFTVAGVTDWTSVGGHGSDTKLRTS